MKILTFVDLHGSLTALKEIKKKSKNVDIILCAGDLSVFEQDLDFLISELSKTKKQAIIVHGNHEDPKTLKKICSKYKNVHFLHKAKKKIKNTLFIGYGGGGFTFEDSEFEKITPKLEKWIKEHKKGNVIVISHAPPFGTKVDKMGVEFVGNISLREFIVKNKIDFFICGHIHENSGKKDKLKQTTLLNPGPKGKIITI